jgi:Arc/MetJ-type ribon-helix-helix transcriptional regulator
LQPSAFAAFCAFRDCGPERNIRKAVEGVEKDEAKRERRYKVWRNWCSKFRWRERAADYDRYIERLKQGEMRKTQREEINHRVTRSFYAKTLLCYLLSVICIFPLELSLSVW